MSKGNIKTFVSSVLPANYKQVGEKVLQAQQALDAWLPEGLREQVQILRVESSVVSLVANSPVIANYLRLHHEPMSKVLVEALRQDCNIEVKTRPASLSRVSLPESRRQPRPLKASTIASLSSGANAIEDETLRDAMRSLARTLAASSKNGSH